MQSPEEKKLLFVAFANFKAVDPTMTNLKLPNWDYWTQSWEEMHIIPSCKLVQIGSSTPVQVLHLVYFSINLQYKILSILESVSGETYQKYPATPYYAYSLIW